MQRELWSQGLAGGEHSVWGWSAGPGVPLTSLTSWKSHLADGESKAGERGWRVVSFIFLLEVISTPTMALELRTLRLKSRVICSSD